MAHKKLLLISLISLLTDSTAVSVHLCTETAKKDVSEYQDQYPSYQCKNAFGKFDHCLRACTDLPAGIMVANAAFAKTDNEFIALHKSKEFRHVAIMGFKQDGLIQWGRVRGKMALVNHSCDPNCALTEHGDVITIKSVKESQELTIAYDAPIVGLDWNPQWNFQCLCNAHNCRKYLDRYDWSKPSRTLNIID